MSQQRILLLENVAGQASGVRERLSQAGFEVAVSRYEADGLKRLAEWRPDLVLLSSSHPAGSLVEYCRLARSAAPAARIVVTSSLNRERLLQEHPELETLVDDVLLRPYGFEEAVRLLKAPGAEAPAAPAAARSSKPRANRLVAAPAGDPELEARLHWGLEPSGVRVATLAPADLEAFCARERPGVLILEWPLPQDFVAEGLARIRSGPGAPAGVLLLADESREAVSGAAPALLNLVDMFFRKPVAWEHFFRVLARHLGLPESAGPRPEPPRPVPPPAPRPPVGEEGLRAEFQRQMEAKFLEVEELKRRLEAATRNPEGAPDEGRQNLEEENERLRQALQEAGKKSSLALAMEGLKRSELEVKLDNLLRMKDDFERRAQDDLDERTRESEQMRLELATAQARADRAADELAALNAELERSLVEKEQLEERLHRLEAGSQPGPDAGAAPAAAPGLAALAAEAARQRALAAEAEAAGADAIAKAAVLAEQLERAEEARGRQAAELAREEQRRAKTAEELRLALERADRAERRIDQLQAERAELEGQALGAAAGRRSAEAALAEANAARAALERELATARDGGSATEQELRERVAAAEEEALEAHERAERRCGELQASLTELEDRARNAEAARVAIAAEAEAAVDEKSERIAALERELAGEREARAAELRLWREKAEGAETRLAALSEQAQERRRLAEQLEETSRRLAESGREAAALQAQAAAAAESGRRERLALEEHLRQARAAAGESAALLERAGAELAREREAAAARDTGARRDLEAARAHARSLEERLAGEAARQPGEERFAGELRRIQELLEEVIDRARTDAVSHARSEAELSARLEAALEDRRLLQERIERSQTEAAERERRSAVLLQSAIERNPPHPPERANLPAVLPPERAPRVSRRTAWLAAAAGLAAAAALVLFLLPGLRRPSPPAVRDPGPAVSRPGGRGEGAAAPNEVWDRWTRTDGSGGVVVQATLRSEQGLRAEVEAERAARGWSEAQARAELVRRLADYRFESTYYVSVYLKHLSPGYPAYLEDLAGRFRLRGGTGKETVAFIPPGHEKSRRVFSFGSGPAAERIYEATATLGFARSGLESSPSYLQLVVSDVGATSRRVLTWELE